MTNKTCNKCEDHPNLSKIFWHQLNKIKIFNESNQKAKQAPTNADCPAQAHLRDSIAVGVIDAK